MRVLIADDDLGQRRLMQHVLRDSGHALEFYDAGDVAWAELESATEPVLAILDWMMPGLEGLEICRRIRALRTAPTYVILLTGRDQRADIIAGLEAGADDYVAKPFHPAELHARVRNGTRVLELQASLSARVKELEAAAANVKALRGLLPICCYCKNIRDDQNYWTRLESYFASNSEVRFSHGICPTCYDKFIEENDPTPESGSGAAPSS